jgi:glycosyltransferase involved in cell wall biosynthesis
MCQALVFAGHQVRLAVPGQQPAEGADWQALSRLYGLQHPFPVEWLPARQAFRRYDFGLRSFSWARDWGADLVYTRLPQAAAISSALGMKVILEVHDFPQGTWGPLLFRLFLKGHGAQRMVVITHALASDLEAKYGVPAAPPFTVVAPDGVDLDRYRDLPAPAEARRRLGMISALQPQGKLPGSLPERFTVGYTGHLYRGRGVELLLGLARSLPQITFLLAGGEPADVARLQAEARSLHLENLVLTGFIPNADLPRYQAACDVLLMPYQRSVAASSGGDIGRYLSPMKMFEYLACGRAILSTDLPVLREVLNPENAVLLPPDDLEAWAAALRLLQADEPACTRLGAAAAAAARQFSWEQRVERILAGLPMRPTGPGDRPVAP